jgi:hypothetical protein
MNTLAMLGSIIGILVLRLGVPLAVTGTLAWWLRRLDNRWQAENRAEYWAENWGRQHVEAVKGQERQQPCWMVRGCSAEDRAACAAYGRPTLPCWLVRLRREGKLPKACVGCELFAIVQSAAVRSPTANLDGQSNRQPQAL